MWGKFSMYFLVFSVKYLLKFLIFLPGFYQATVIPEIIEVVVKIIPLIAVSYL